MTNLTRTRLAIVAFAALGGIAAAQAAETISFQKLIDEKSPALATVKFVLKIKAGAMGEHETETEITAMMIEPKGLLLCSNAQLSAFTSIGGADITATPTEIKVLIGDDSEGVDAKLLARDTELDLAWLQIEKPAEKPYVFIDFHAGSEAKIGDTLLSIRRMNKYFDRAPAISEGRLGGVVTKPRRLYVSAGNVATGPGQLVFSADGKPVGMTVVQVPGDEDEANFDPMSRISAWRLLSEMILPATEIVKATEKAKANPLPTSAPADSGDSDKGDKDAGDKADKKPAGDAKPKKTDAPRSSNDQPPFIKALNYSESGDKDDLPYHFALSALRAQAGIEIVNGDRIKGSMAGIVDSMRATDDGTNKLFVPEGYRLLQVRVDSEKAESAAGKTFNYDAQNEYSAIDLNGDVHMLSGYFAMVARNGKQFFEMHYPGAIDDAKYKSTLDFKDIKPKELRHQGSELALLFIVKSGTGVHMLRNQDDYGVGFAPAIRTIPIP